VVIKIKINSNEVRWDFKAIYMKAMVMNAYKKNLKKPICP
jgi:hypothetical protein